MAKMQQPLADFNRNAIEAMLGFAQVSMENAEKLMRLQLDAAKRFMSEQGESVRALAEAKDTAAMMSVRSRLTEQTLDRAQGYWREVYQLVTSAQQQMNKVFEQSFGDYQQDVSSALEKMVKAAPGGSDATAAAIRSTMEATRAAIDNMTKAARQAAELADANAKAVTEAATHAFRGAPKK